MTHTRPARTRPRGPATGVRHPGLQLPSERQLARAARWHAADRTTAPFARPRRAGLRLTPGCRFRTWTRGEASAGFAPDGPVPAPGVLSTGLSPGRGKDRGNVDNSLCAKCALFAVAGLASTPAGRLGLLLHRARSASRSKQLAGAVGGSRRFPGDVDESATGSVNFFGPILWSMQHERLPYAALGEVFANCALLAGRPLAPAAGTL
jgi:hypothetical protein